ALCVEDSSAASKKRSRFSSCTTAKPSPLLLPCPHGLSLDSVALRLCHRRRPAAGLHLLPSSQRKRPTFFYRPSRGALLRHSQYLSLHQWARHGCALRPPGRVAEASDRCRPGDDGSDAADGDGSARSL